MKRDGTGVESCQAAPTLWRWTTTLWTEPFGPRFGDCMGLPSGAAACKRFATGWRCLIRWPRSRPGRWANSPRAAPPVIDHELLPTRDGPARQQAYPERCGRPHRYIAAALADGGLRLIRPLDFG